MAILLIGSTGNGKSTLGNFLLNPDKDHIFGDHQTFVTARTNRPETQCVLSSSFDVGLDSAEGAQLTVVDTPGIFEDDDKDMGHMIKIIKALHTVGKIRMCVFVVKFSSKIDTPYKASVKYYSKLLPGVFDSNLMVALTDYACDERSKNLRAMQGINEEEIRANIVTELVKVSGITYTPKLLALDCLPVTVDERQTNLQVREGILRHALTLTPVETKNLKVAKTDAIIASDKLVAAKLDGEVTAYKSRLQSATLNALSIKAEVEESARRLESLRKELSGLQDDLQVKDTTELVEAKEWSVREKWKWFKVQTSQFEVESPWPVQNVVYWTNGKCRWINRSKLSDNVIQGSVKGKFMRGLYASVKLEVHHRDKFQSEISNIKADISSSEDKISTATQEHDTSKRRHSEVSSEVDLMVRSIHTKKTEIDKLLSEYLTMNECVERFGR